MLRAVIFDLINIIEGHCIEHEIVYPQMAMERANEALQWTENFDDIA